MENLSQKVAEDGVEKKEEDRTTVSEDHVDDKKPEEVRKGSEISEIPLRSLSSHSPSLLIFFATRETQTTPLTLPSPSRPSSLQWKALWRSSSSLRRHPTNREPGAIGPYTPEQLSKFGWFRMRDRERIGTRRHVQDIVLVVSSVRCYVSSFDRSREKD